MGPASRVPMNSRIRSGFHVMGGDVWRGGTVYLRGLLESLAETYPGALSVVVRRAGWISPSQAIGYLLFLRRYISLLKGSALYWRALGFLLKSVIAFVSSTARVKLRRWIKPAVWWG